MEEPAQTIEKPKGKHSARKGEERMTGKKEPYAYTIKDKTFGELKVLNSANAWWLEQTKVQHLIDAYKIDANDEEACSYAGISLRQLKYFNELHPDFCTIKQACYQVLGLTAKQALARKVTENPEWYLTRKRKDEYSPRIETTGPDGRGLYEELSEDLRQLGEELRNGRTGKDAETTTSKNEHAGGADAGAPDAGKDGHRDEAGVANTSVVGPTVHS